MKTIISSLLIVIIVGLGAQAFGFLSIEPVAPEIPFGEIKIGTWVNYETGKLVTSPIIEIDLNPISIRSCYSEYCRNDTPNVIYTIPTWVLNISEWYQQDLITFEEYRNVQQYLIKEGIAELQE